jgi:hypothetical protein
MGGLPGPTPWCGWPHPGEGAEDEAHLHFHLIDAAGGPSAIEGNALPFGFDAFRYEGAIHDFETGEVTPAPPPVVRRRQLPLSGDITEF